MKMVGDEDGWSDFLDLPTNRNHFELTRAPLHHGSANTVSETGQL